MTSKPWEPSPVSIALLSRALCLDGVSTKEGIGYVMKENAFLEIDDFEKAQELSDKIRVEKLHKILDILAKRYCPVIEKHQLTYR